MMRWLVWTLLWLTLLAGAGWYLWRRLRWLWGRSELLGETLTEAEAILAQASETAEDAFHLRRTAAPLTPPEELAIFRDPAQVATERDHLREQLRAQRAARRSAALPGWARRVDSR